MELVTLAGGPTARMTAASVIALLLLARGRKRPARLLLVAVGGASLFNTVIKEMVGRRRPMSLPDVAQSGGWSFPSGHANGSLVFFGILTYIVWQITRSRSATLMVGTGAALASGLIGYSRIALRQHHLGDVLAGYLLGASWIAFLLRAYTRSRPHDTRRPRP